MHVKKGFNQVAQWSISGVSLRNQELGITQKLFCYKSPNFMEMKYEIIGAFLLTLSLSDKATHNKGTLS